MFYREHGESNLIRIGNKEVVLDWGIEEALSQVTDDGKLPDTEDLLKRFEKYGFFSEGRTIGAKEGTRGYGGTEILAAGLKTKLLDAVVCVCDGVGTIITHNPEIVYGIGNEQPIIKDTKRIEKLAKRLRDKGVYTLKKPGIRQLEGVKKAQALGYKNIGVTLISEEFGEYDDCVNDRSYWDWNRRYKGRAFETLLWNTDINIFTVFYYPPTRKSYMDIAFTEKELPDSRDGRKRLQKIYLNVFSIKGELLVESYMQSRFGRVKYIRQEGFLGTDFHLDLDPKDPANHIK